MYPSRCQIKGCSVVVKPSLVASETGKKWWFFSRVRNRSVALVLKKGVGQKRVSGIGSPSLLSLHTGEGVRRLRYDGAKKDKKRTRDIQTTR